MLHLMKLFYETFVCSNKLYYRIILVVVFSCIYFMKLLFFFYQFTYVVDLVTCAQVGLVILTMAKN